MKRFFTSLFAIAVLAAGVAWGQVPTDPNPQDQVDTFEIQRWGDRVVVTGEGPRAGSEILYSMATSPPENDAGRWFVTVWGTSTDSGTAGLVDAFSKSRELAPFIAESPTGAKPWAHFNRYFADDPTQKWRFEKFHIPLNGPFPIVTINAPRDGSFGGITEVKNPDGSVSIKQVIVDVIPANELGKEPADLAKRIRAVVALWCQKLQQGGFVPGTKKTSSFYGGPMPANLLASFAPPPTPGPQQAPPANITSTPIGGFPFSPNVIPPQPAVNPSWPPGGPAADQALTLEQIKAAVPEAPADFILSTLLSKPTSVDAVKLQWMLYLQAHPELAPKPVAPVTPPAPAPGGWLATILTLFGGMGGTGLIVWALKAWRQSQVASGKTPMLNDQMFNLLISLISQLNPQQQARVMPQLQAVVTKELQSTLFPMNQ